MLTKPWFKISVFFGILSMVFSLLSLEYIIDHTVITMPWSILFTVIASLAYGKRGAIVSSLFGGMWIPVLLWPENGLGLISNIIAYAGFFILIGHITEKTNEKRAIKKHIFQLIGGFLLIYLFLYFFAFRWLLSLGGDEISYWTTTVIVIKNTIFFVFILIFAESLMRTNNLRKFLQLKPNVFGANNFKLIGYSFLSSVLIWFSFYLLDIMLIQNEGERQYVGLLFMIIFFSSGVISRWLIYASESQLKAELFLRESEQRLRNLSDNLPKGMAFQLDMGSHGEKRDFTYVSAGVEKIHELTEKEVLQDSTILYKQIFEEDLSQIYEVEKQALENLTTFVAEARFKLPSGAVQWHLITSAPRRASNGNLIWDGIELDITVRKKAEIELEQYKNYLEQLVKERTEDLENANEELTSSNEELCGANEKLNEQRILLEQTLKRLKETQSQLVQTEKMASLGVLTSGIAHEINNPLNYILGSYSGLEMLFQDKYEKNETVSTLLESMKIGIDRATNIVKSLNQFSYSMGGLDEICDIHSIIDNCLLILNNQLKDRVEVTREFFDGQNIVHGNSGKLHQVFLNILTNAAHAISNNGLISIKTTKNKDYITIEIKDNGCGISEKNLAKVTDPFFTTKEAGKGTGLGLSITYTIIKEHKGKLEFLSEENNWTLVKIKLPIKIENE